MFYESFDVCFYKHDAWFVNYFKRGNVTRPTTGEGSPVAHNRATNAAADFEKEEGRRCPMSPASKWVPMPPSCSACMPVTTLGTKPQEVESLILR
jgi:hypothetical protein